MNIKLDMLTGKYRELTQKVSLIKWIMKILQKHLTNQNRLGL